MKITQISLLIFITGFIGATLFPGNVYSDSSKEKQKQHEYVGVKKCATCHKTEKQGSQFSKWKEALHAKAFQTLATDKAKAIGTKYGIAEPQKSAKCLKCHVTAYEEPKKLTEKLDPADGIQCETCHGPGKDYMKKSVMKDQKLSLKNGLILPDEKMCVKCHNKDSPTFTSFNFEEMYKKITHPLPKGHTSEPDDNKEED